MPENLVKRENFIVGAVNKMGRRQVKAKVLCRSVDVQLIKRSSARTLAPPQASLGIRMQDGG